MNFGMTNAPLTFVMLMNLIFKDLLGKFMVIYLDDIIIFCTLIFRAKSYLLSFFTYLIIVSLAVFSKLDKNRIYVTMISV